VTRPVPPDRRAAAGEAQRREHALRLLRGSGNALGGARGGDVLHQPHAHPRSSRRARPSVHHFHADVTENLGEVQLPSRGDRVGVLPKQVRLNGCGFSIADPLGAGESGATVQAGEEVRHGVRCSAAR
jgi:hypothetical protein